MQKIVVDIYFYRMTGERKFFWGKREDFGGIVEI